MFVTAPLWRGPAIRGRYWGLGGRRGLGQVCGDDPNCITAVTSSFGSSTLTPDIMLALQGGEAGPSEGSGSPVIPGMVTTAAQAIGQQSTMQLVLWGVAAIAAGVLVAGVFGKR